MSECVVRMEMPKSCDECRRRYLFNKCSAYNGSVIRRSENCPIICQLPEGHGRLVDADDYIKHLFTEWVNGEISNSEWCDLRQWMNEATTIVPAERSEE